MYWICIRTLFYFTFDCIYITDIRAFQVSATRVWNGSPPYITSASYLSIVSWRCTCSRAIETLIVSGRVCLSFCLSFCPHFQNASSPSALVRISWYFNTVLLWIVYVFHTDNGLRLYDVSNVVMNSVILEISNDAISGMCRLSYFVFDSRCIHDCQQRANHIYRLVFLAAAFHNFLLLSCSTYTVTVFWTL